MQLRSAGMGWVAIECSFQCGHSLKKNPSHTTSWCPRDATVITVRDISGRWPFHPARHHGQRSPGCPGVALPNGTRNRPSAEANMDHPASTRTVM